MIANAADALEPRVCKHDGLIIAQSSSPSTAGVVPRQRPRSADGDSGTPPRLTGYVQSGVACWGERFRKPGGATRGEHVRPAETIAGRGKARPAVVRVFEQQRAKTMSCRRDHVIGRGRGIVAVTGALELFTGKLKQHDGICCPPAAQALMHRSPRDGVPGTHRFRDPAPKLALRA